jgi:hypothetical protein
MGFLTVLVGVKCEGNATFSTTLLCILKETFDGSLGSELTLLKKGSEPILEVIPPDLGASSSESLVTISHCSSPLGDRGILPAGG